MSPATADLAGPGFWGKVTSTVDWCEVNYQYTPYVCELFNTVSSLAMVAVGLLGIGLHRHILERRFLFAYFIVIIVGIGSIAFHGTLQFELQMLDELPMLYEAILTVFILTENRKTRRFGVWFPALLVGHAILVTYLQAFPRGNVQFYAFHFSFGTLEFYSLYQVTRIFLRRKMRDITRLWWSGMTMYVVALILWLTDLKACNALRALPVNPQLHAWWHVLVSAGLYFLLVLIAYDRALTLEKNPEVRRWLGFIPYVAYRT